MRRKGLLCRGRRIIVTASLVLLGLILLSFARFDVGRYHSRIQTEMEQQLNRKVTFGNVKFGLFPLRLYVKDPVIWEDPNFGTQVPFVRADSMFLSVRMLSVLTHKLDVNTATFLQPQVELVKNRRGEWNFMSLGISRLSGLILRNGRIALTDQQEIENRALYDHVDFTVQNYVRGKPFFIDAMAHAGDRSDQGMHLRGRVGPLSETNVLNTPLDGTLTLNNMPIRGFKDIIDTHAVASIGGTATGKTEIRTEQSKISAVGSLKLEGLSLNDVDIGYTVTLRYTLAEDRPTGVIEIPSAIVDLADASVSMRGLVNLRPAPAELNLKVQTSNASSAGLARLAAAFGGGGKTTMTGEITADVQIQGPVRSPRLNGTISGRNLRVAGKPSVNFTLVSSNAELAKLRSLAGAWGAKGLTRINGSGTVNLDLRVQGSLQLGGNASVNLTNVHLPGTDFSKGMFPKINQPIEIEQVTGHFVLNRGDAETNDLRVRLNVGGVAAKGVLNVENQTLNLRATAVLTKAASKQLTGSGPAGLVARTLLNNNGEAVVPGIITGTFANPIFKPDKEQMALSRLKGILPTSKNPAAWLESLVGAENHHQQSNGNASPSPSPAKSMENAVQHVLGDIKK